MPNTLSWWASETIKIRDPSPGNEFTLCATGVIQQKTVRSGKTIQSVPLSRERWRGRPADNLRPGAQFEALRFAGAGEDLDQIGASPWRGFEDRSKQPKVAEVQASDKNEAFRVLPSRPSAHF